MPVNSCAFVASFLPATLLGLFLLGRYRDSRPAKAWVVAVSLAWYSVADPRRIALLAGSALP